jgi:type III secretory pathway component EscS
MLKALTIVIFAELGVMIAAAVFAVVVGILKKPTRIDRLGEGSS